MEKIVYSPTWLIIPNAKKQIKPFSKTAESKKLKHWTKREAINIASKKGIKIRLLKSTKTQIVHI